jgi:tetratricopeptide (TPR) repeat protein
LVIAMSKNNKPKNSNEIKGDAIESTIISGDNNVVSIIKNVIYQKTQNISSKAITFFLLGFVGLVFIAILGAWEYYLKYDASYMGGQLNVVVEPFLEEKDGRLRQSDDGLILAQYFYSQLKSDVTSGRFEDETNIRLEVRGPQDALPLRNVNWAGADSAAQKVAKRINAHIVIYGVITTDEFNRRYVSVRFYVSPDQFGDAQEILGENELGNPILLTGDPKSGVDLEGENEELRNRVQVVSLLMKAIGAYVGEDFEKSLQYLEIGLSNNLWKQTSGQEVVYLLAGNVASRLALPVLLQEGEEQALKTIIRAENFYQLAIQSAAHKGNYSRSYIGLAGVENFLAVYKARLSNDYSDIDLAALEREEEYLNLALSADHKPPSADVEEKVAFNRAQVFLLRSQISEDAALLDQANEQYQIVIDAYNSGNKRLRELAAHSYSGQALIARGKGQFDAAIAKYKMAFEITRIPSLQALYLYHIGNVYYETNDQQNALKHYLAAIEMEEDLLKRISPEQLKNIENRIQDLQGLLRGLYPLSSTQ